MKPSERLRLWFEDQKANRGLVDFKVMLGDSAPMELEVACQGILDMIHAPVVADHELI